MAHDGLVAGGGGYGALVPVDCLRDLPPALTIILSKAGHIHRQQFFQTDLPSNFGFALSVKFGLTLSVDIGGNIAAWLFLSAWRLCGIQPEIT